MTTQYRQIHAFLHHVDLLHNVNQMVSRHLVRVCLITLDLHQTAVPNVSHHPNARATLRALTSIAVTRVQDRVVYPQIAMCSITTLSVHAILISLETRSLCVVLRLKNHCVSVANLKTSHTF